MSKRNILAYLLANVIPCIYLFLSYSDRREESFHFFLVCMIASVILCNSFCYYAPRPKPPFLLDDGIAMKKSEAKSIFSYVDVKSVTISLCDFSIVNNSPYILIKPSKYAYERNEGKKEYIPLVTLYNSEIHPQKKYNQFFEPRTADFHFFISKKRKEELLVIFSKTTCTIWVTDSFLQFNGWSIGDFAREYSVDKIRIKIISDNC